MKERPILFSAPMVHALLDGSKTQTRRVVKFNDRLGRWDADGFYQVQSDTITKPLWTEQSIRWNIASPYGQPGDRLWVRETFNRTNPWGGDGGTYFYRATDEQDFRDAVWKPSIHMPRKASRISLEVTRVRVERLHAINEVDSIAEGAPWAACGSPQEGNHKAGYAQLWESINGPGSWDLNPWVWVIEFKRVTP